MRWSRFVHMFHNRWMWDRDVLRVVVGALTVAGIALTVLFLPVLGLRALWWLALVLAGVVWLAIYGLVGRKVRALVASLRDESGELSETVIQHNGIQSPGVAVLDEAQLRLVPIVGQPVTVPLSSITAVKHPRTLFGKSFVGKRVLVLETPAARRVGFVLPPATARRWSLLLAQMSEP